MPTVDPHKRLETIREYIAGSPEGREIAGLSRDEKVEWTHHLLDQIRYEALSKTEKGLVRQYLQSVTGYSRAQVERYISAYRKLVADDKRPTLTTAQTPVTPEPAAAAREVSATPVRLAQGVSFGIPLLLGATVLVLAVSLAKVSSQLPASLLALTRTNSAVSSSSSSVSPAPRPAASSSPTTTKISLAAAQTRPFTAIEGRIEIRRAARISAVPSPIAKHMIVPTRAQYKTQLTATLATISGSPAEGQIVVFKNGKAVWGDLPTELQSAPAGLL
ncbi:MAG: hypothetical protein HOO67_01145, partial [Candidatus Peribacteraceae bacterium]|nr:hypothetical protein [Candidatus Peribacteraceae bacterium]